MMIGQKTLRPTVVSVYNYVQPLVSVTVSVIVGLAVFKGMQAIAAILIFSGVWLVVKSKSKMISTSTTTVWLTRKDMLKRYNVDL